MVNCKSQSAAERASRWRRQNPERCRRNRNEWNSRNRERVRQLERVARKRRGYTEKLRQQKRRYYVRHREEIAKKNKIRYLKNKRDPVKYAKELERCRRKALVWRNRNLQKARDNFKKWAKANPERVRIRSLKGQRVRRARKSIGSHTVGQWLARVAFYGWRCVYCNASLTVQSLTKDHRIAISKGGTDFSSNLVPACRACNSSKGNRHNGKLHSSR